MNKISCKPEVYRIPVPLPGNPLKELNSYLIRSGGESMLVDTGFHHPDCLMALNLGLDQLEVDRRRLRIFITHLHTDHIGSVSDISDEETVIYMSETDYRIYRERIEPEGWDEMDQRFRAEGFPENGLLQITDTNPARKYMPNRVFRASFVEDGMRITLGAAEMVCVGSKGHTPGHVCLYLPEAEILFLGDHVLFDITPNISCWNGVEDSLGDYLESLERMKQYPAQIYLSGHRSPQGDFKARVEEIKEHHRRRIEETYEAVKGAPGCSAFEAASHLTWSMRGRSWDEFPMEQRWFAVGETIAHLDYLRVRGRINSKSSSYGIIYFPAAF